MSTARRKITLGAPQRVKADVQGDTDATLSAVPESLPAVHEGNQETGEVIVRKQQDDTKKLSTNTNIKVAVPAIPSWDELQARKRQGLTGIVPSGKNEGITTRESNEDEDPTQTAQGFRILPNPPPMTVATNRHPNRHLPPVAGASIVEQKPSRAQQHATQPNVLATVSHKIPTQEDASKSMLGTRIEVDGCGFRLIKEIGRGGTSTVFCALREDNVNHKDSLVALKHVVGTENVQALKEEIELLIRLKNNPFVIQHIAHDVSAGSIGVLVMELGQTDISSCLAELTTNKATGKKDMRLHRNTTRYFFQGMLEAVQAIHDCRIVHGDLKPANFVFVRGRIKLIDFGIAKSIRDDTINITRESQTGTMNYIPPEALVANTNHQYKLSCKADVWSLGCILYSLVYGHPPFHDISHIGRKIYAITSSDYAISYPDLTGEFSDKHLLDAMRACLQRDPSRRIGLHDLLAHPFLTYAEAPTCPRAPHLAIPTITPKLFYNSVVEVIKNAGHIAEAVGPVTSRVTSLASEYAARVIQSQQPGLSLDSALSLLQGERSTRKALAAISSGGGDENSYLPIVDKENPRSGFGLGGMQSMPSCRS